MKILIRLCFLVFVPIIVGLALLLSGYDIGSMILAFGTPAVMGVLVIIGLIMALTGKLFPANNADKGSDAAEQLEQNRDPAVSETDGANDGGTDEVKRSEKEKEVSALQDINCSNSYASQFKLAEYETEHIKNGTTKKGCVIGIILVVLAVIDVALAVVFTIKQIWVGSIICVAIFGGSVVIGLITAVVRQAISMHGDISKAKKFIRGSIKSCVLSSAVKHERSSSPTVRVSGVVYRVIVAGDGGEYEAFSRRFYDTDETVVIAAFGKKRAKIVETDDLINKSEQLKNEFDTCLTTGETVVIKHNDTACQPMHRHSHRRRH